MATIRDSLANEIRKGGIDIQSTPTRAEYYLMVTFLERPDSLFLNGSLLDAKDGSTVVASGAIEIPVKKLPPYWKKRSLHDVAYELTGKLEEKLFAQRASIVLGEFSGGKEKRDAYVSEFSTTMKGYIKEEMIKSGVFVILSPSKEHRGGGDAATLTGHFIVTADDVIFRLVLLKGKRNRREIANVSAQFKKDTVPQGMPMFPGNINIVSQNTDHNNDKESFDTGVSLRAWINKESGIYRNNDKLVVYLRPEEDCYARVYYIQSDGAIIQTFPSSDYDPGFLKKFRTYGVGGKKDDVELLITDETVGQEFIKVFASRYPIDDSSIPREFIRGPNVYRVRGKYRGLQESLARGLKVSRRRLRPVAEVKLLVK